MSEKIQLQVVTSTDTAFEITIKDIYIPAYFGEAGVLGNHKPYISLLQPGEIVYTDINDKRHYLYIREGIIEVRDNKIAIISDSVEPGEKLVKEEVEKRLEELDRRIKSSIKGEITAEELQEALVEQREFAVKQKIIRNIERK